MKVRESQGNFGIDCLTLTERPGPHNARGAGAVDDAGVVAQLCSCR